MRRLLYVISIIIIIILSVILIVRKQPANVPTPEAPETVEQERLPVLTDKEKTRATVYYATGDGGFLLPVNLEIKATTEVAQEALEKLLAGPPDENALDSVPVDAKLLEIYSIYNTVYVNFTKEFVEIPKEQAQLAIDAVIATVLPLVDGYRLQILIEGEGREFIGGVRAEEPFGMPLINPVYVTNDGEYTKQQLDADGDIVTYYLADPTMNYLVPQNLVMMLSGGEARPLERARAALNAMVEQPDLGYGRLARIMPVGVELLDIRIENHVAYADFSSHILIPMGAKREKAMLQALTHSVLGIDGIESLQISVDGIIFPSLPDGSDISQPLTVEKPINMKED